MKIEIGALIPFLTITTLMAWAALSASARDNQLLLDGWRFEKGDQTNASEADFGDSGRQKTSSARKSSTLASLDLKNARQYYWDGPKPGMTFDKNIPSINGTEFKFGVSVRGESVMAFDLKGFGEQVTGEVGIDDEVIKTFKGPARCLIYGDQKLLWRSEQLQVGTSPKPFDVDLRGVKILELVGEASGDDIYATHIDWVNVVFHYAGHKPVSIEPALFPSAPLILTPKPAAKPRINGAQVFGVRPNAPFLFTIAVSGLRPMVFSVEGLPAGLSVDACNGRITGVLKEPGEHTVTIRSSNAFGVAERKLRIVVGENIALSPQMGWSSWNCWGSRVDQDKVLRAARALVASGLADHGFSYVNVDDAWQAQRGGAFNALQGNEKFPDIKAMCDQIHNLGLKAGIYSTPWAKSFAGYPGGSSDQSDGAFEKSRAGSLSKFGKYSFMDNDARQWVAWGIDYLKCDWGSPDPVHGREIAAALRKSGRDIVFSLSCDAPFEYASEYPRIVNSWRTTTDITDTWQVLCGIGFSQDRWSPYGGPGHWIDPDMLEVGQVANGPTLHATRLTADEQYLHLSMWCLLSAPLILGCDLEKLDDFTLGLLTNDEVLDIDQDSLGKPARRVLQDGYFEVWVKELADGAKAVGFFNRGRQEIKSTVGLSKLGIEGTQTIRDLWRQKTLGEFNKLFPVTVRPHGVVLVKMCKPNS